MAKGKRKLTSNELGEAPDYDSMRSDKAAYEAMIQKTLAEALDDSFRKNAGKLADVPGMVQSDTDERVLLPTPGNRPFTPGLEGFQDTAISPIGPPEPLATYAGKMGPIGAPYGRPAGLNTALPAIHPNARVLRTPAMAPADEGVEPALFAPELPATMASRVPQMPVRLPNVEQAPYEMQQSAFGALLDQFFTPSPNIERAPREQPIRPGQNRGR